MPRTGSTPKKVRVNGLVSLPCRFCLTAVFRWCVPRRTMVHRSRSKRTDIFAALHTAVLVSFSFQAAGLRESCTLTNPAPQAQCAENFSATEPIQGFGKWKTKNITDVFCFFRTKATTPKYTVAYSPSPIGNAHDGTEEMYVVDDTPLAVLLMHLDNALMI